MKIKKKKGDLFIEGEILELIEAGEGQEPGRTWDVILIKPGLSKNQTYYSEAVLRKAAHLFEGAPALGRSDDAHSWNMDISVKNIVGLYTEVEFREGALRAQLHIMEDGQWLHTKLLEARALGKKDIFGLSIVAGGTAILKKHQGQMVRWVESIDSVTSVDPVVFPAAGGRMVRLAAAENDTLKGEIEMLNTLLKLIEAKRPDLLTGKDLENLTEPEILAMADTAMLTEAEIAEAKKPLEPTKKEPEIKKIDLTEAETRIVEAEKRFTCRMLLNEKLAECKLPTPAVTRIKALMNGKIFTEAELDATIKSERDYLALFTGGGQIIGAGGQLEVSLDVRERKIAALDGFFFRTGQKVGEEIVPPYRSFKEAYIDLTGDKYLTGRLSEATNLRQMTKFAEMGHFSESMISSTLNTMLGDSITRRMVAEYRMPGLDEWRAIVSDINPIMDFRSNKRERMGGYGDLAAVAERGDYLAMTSPGDEEAYYSISKRGGTEDITLEMIANDDIGAVRRIPIKLALAAKSTLFNFVMAFLTDNPTCTYDSTALFEASSHLNYSASGLALSASSLNAIRYAMRSQAAYGNATQILGLVPRILLIPNELEDLANKLCTATVNLISNATTEVSDMPNLHKGIRPVVIDNWTDANDYYVIGDVAMCPTIELGFFQGREEPELFLQSAPEIGSMFLADKLTWKIRHIYGGGILDHRNMYYSKV